MHEMGIALQIIEIASDSIPKELIGARVARINVSVGKLSAIVPDSLRFCFDIASRGTPIEGAELSIEQVPVVARCNACGREWTIQGPAFSCEKCQSGDIVLLSGRELDIRSIEVEEKEENK